MKINNAVEFGFLILGTVLLAAYLGWRYHPYIAGFMLLGLIWASFDLGYIQKNNKTSA